MKVFDAYINEPFDPKTLSEVDKIKRIQEIHALGEPLIGKMVYVPGFPELKMCIDSIQVNAETAIYGGSLYKYVIKVKTIRFNKSSQRFETELFNHSVLQEVNA